MNADDERDFSQIMHSISTPGGRFIWDAIPSLDAPDLDAPKYPVSMRGYDEDRDMMRFPESEILDDRSYTLEEIAEAIVAARVKLNVPADYEAFVDPEFSEYEDPRMWIWFGREETEEEEAARVNYIDARLRYWEREQESAKPVSYHWVEEDKGEPA